MSTWRDAARPVIARVLRETKGRSEPEVRAALKAAYPFGPRKYHPYRIWLDEIHHQRQDRPRLSVADLCTCDNTRAAHREGKGACMAADCTCAKFTPVQTELIPA